MRLNNKEGGSAGNIDIVLAALDEHGHVIDFGTVEVQAVCTRFKAELLKVKSWGNLHDQGWRQKLNQSQYWMTERLIHRRMTFQTEHE